MIADACGRAENNRLINRRRAVEKYWLRTEISFLFDVQGIG